MMEGYNGKGVSSRVCVCLYVCMYVCVCPCAWSTFGFQHLLPSGGLVWLSGSHEYALISLSESPSMNFQFHHPVRVVLGLIVQLLSTLALFKRTSSIIPAASSKNMFNWLCTSLEIRGRGGGGLVVPCHTTSELLHYLKLILQMKAKS